MRKPEADMSTEWAKHLRAGRGCARGKDKKNRGNKRVYYHSLRQRLKKKLRRYPE